MTQITDLVGYAKKHNLLDDAERMMQLLDGLAALTAVCHGNSFRSGWWTDPNTGKEQIWNFGEKIALVHSELSEALEGKRKNKMDEHLPHRLSIEVELGDAVIRIFDLAGKLGLNLGEAIIEKLEYNAKRPDHKLENRKKSDGKKF